MIILDTNVISEIIKKQPDEHVANWLRNQDTSNLATTAITVAELLAGICRMPGPDPRRATIRLHFFIDVHHLAKNSRRKNQIGLSFLQHPDVEHLPRPRTR